MRAVQSTVRLASLLLLALASPSRADVGACGGLTPPLTTTREKRPITSRDLALLRDIGPVEIGNVNAAILGLSPDGAKVAFQVRQGHPEINSYCIGMFVVDVRGTATPVRIDQGGTFIKGVNGFAGLTAMPAGYAAVVTPKWSPDGAWIAFLRRDDGVTQVWRARADGGQSEPVTHLSYDAEDFWWTRDGRSVVVAGRPSLLTLQKNIETEAAEGFLYGDRFNPLRGSGPFPRDPVPKAYVTVEASTHQRRVSTEVEMQLGSAKNEPLPKGAIFVARSPDHDESWVTAVDPSALLPSTVLHVTFASGATYACDTPTCRGIVGLWWSKTGTEVRFLKREGWQNSQFGLYRWRPAHGAPKRLLLTDDYLAGCQRANDELVCARETTVRPRHLVSIDRDGRVRELFDPNPEFASIQLGTVERLRWRNSYGREAYGDLVLPPGYRRERKLPLVVVGYVSRGFLRGGVGDEYPIYPLAARGFAVLSFNRPDDVGLLKSPKTWEEVERLNRDDWADFRSVQDAMEKGIDVTVGRGIVDADKVGLTGLSNGATTTQFALINSNQIYAAAALSTCCEDPSATSLLAGPALTKVLREVGYPLYTEGGGTFWRGLSLGKNAASVRTPLLMQLSDDEYLGGLEGYTALKELGKPVEMYVFPGEHHIKFQPAHRLAVYERNIDWFDFWLKGKEDSQPAKANQYSRWRAMRPPPNLHP